MANKSTNKLNLSQSTKYSTGSGKWSEVGPVRCDLDEQLVGLCEHCEGISPTQREALLAQPMHWENGWTLIRFALRMGVFALRENDPTLFKTGLRGFAFALNHEDPRDIYTTSAKLIYVAVRLGLDPAEIFAEYGMLDQSWLRKWFDHRVEQKGESDWRQMQLGILAIESELGTGLIDCSGQYRPESDLIALAMRICRVIESNPFYLSTHIRLDQSGPPSSAPSGRVSIDATPNPDAHPEMKNQFLRMWLTEYETAELANQIAEKHHVASNETGFYVLHGKLMFTLRAKSWVLNVDNVETDESIRRFEAPIAALVKNFHRFQWQTWQAFDDGGCLTLTAKVRAAEIKREGQLTAAARLLYEFDASTGEEASTIHYERQGWERYKPIGEPAPCPNQCGSFYYPLGSGDCPVCESNR